jgi:hypothetical protein
MNRRELLKIICAIGVSGVVPRFACGAAAKQPTKLLFVHGRGQQGLNPDTLKSEWLDALNEGAATFGQKFPAEVDVAFPFYGDLLDKYTQQFGIPLTSDVHARGTATDDEFLAFQAEFAEAIRERAGVTDAQVDAEYGHDPSPRGPLNWKWVQAILRAVDKNTSGMNQKAIETLTRDVFLYSTRAGVTDEIDRVVASKLTEEPTVIVSHSLGTVVAYHILRTDRRVLQVPLFVTLGSPLGVRALRDQFRPLQYPSAVGAWYNAFDTRDVVALYPLDANNFPVRPPIENNPSVQNETSNRHGIAGYLHNGDVARRILNAFGEQQATPNKS